MFGKAVYPENMADQNSKRRSGCEALQGSGHSAPYPVALVEDAFGFRTLKHSHLGFIGFAPSGNVLMKVGVFCVFGFFK